MKNASFQVMSVAVDTLYNWYGKISGSSVDYASTVNTQIFGDILVQSFCPLTRRIDRPPQRQRVWKSSCPCPLRSIATFRDAV